MDVIGRHHGHTQLAGQLKQPFVALGVALGQVLLQFDKDVCIPKPVQVVPQLGFTILPAALSHQTRQVAFSAAGQQDEAFGAGWEMLGVQPGVAPVAANPGVGDELAQVAVAHRRLGQQGQVGTVGKGNFRPDDGVDADGIGRAGELHGPAQVVVVGEGQRRIFQRLWPGAGAPQWKMPLPGRSNCCGSAVRCRPCS